MKLLWNIHFFGSKFAGNYLIIDTYIGMITRRLIIFNKNVPQKLAVVM